MQVKEENSIFRQWAEVTTAHGFLDFSRTETKVGKAIWFFLIATSLLIMCYQLSRGIQDFTKHEWKTSVQEIAANGVASVPFPSVIVCNVNRLKWSKAREYNMTLDMISYVFYQLGYYADYIAENESALKAEKEFVRWRKAHNFSYSDIFDKIAPACDDIFLGVDNATNICKERAIIPIDTVEYGRCQRYEHDSQALFVGSKGGFTMMLDAQADDYVPLVENNHIGQGLLMQVVYGGEELGQWLTLNPGIRTSVAMQINEKTIRKQEKSLLNPFALFDSEAPCFENPKLSFSNANRYSAVNGWIECNYLIPFTICNCIFYIKLEGYRTCEIEEMQKCREWENYNVSNEKMMAFNNSIEQCYADLKPACYGKTVDTQLSVTKFPSDQQIESGMWDDWVKSNNKYVSAKDLIMLDIYFRTLDVKLMEQYEVMSFDNLISSSGGLIGLWVGMSFLTVFQAIAYFFKYIMKFKNDRFKTKTTKVHRSQSF